AAPKAPAEMSSSELRTLIQSDRKGLVAKGMALDEKDAAKFWPLYEAFQKELAEPRRKRNRAILDFISAGADLTDANAKRLADQVLDAGEQEARMRKAHFSKLSKALSPSKAARYMQIENKIEAVLDYETARAIPLAR